MKSPTCITLPLYIILFYISLPLTIYIMGLRYLVPDKTRHFTSPLLLSFSLREIRWVRQLESMLLLKVFFFFLAAIFFSIIVGCDRILPTVFQCDFFSGMLVLYHFYIYIYGCEGKNSAHNLAMSWLKVPVRNVYNVPPSTLQISLKCKFEIHKQPRSISGPIKYSESNARCKCVLFFTFTNVLFHYVLLQVNQQLRLIFCTKIMQVFSNSDNKCFASKKNDIKFKNYLYYIINITFFKSNLQFAIRFAKICYKAIWTQTNSSSFAHQPTWYDEADQEGR